VSELRNTIKGTVEEAKGKLTGDRSEEVKGKARKAWGNLEGKMDDLRGDLADRRDEPGTAMGDPAYDDSTR
jgi:uncharacterized protein YjbJ (UPF0337 family)